MTTIYAAKMVLDADARMVLWESAIALLDDNEQQKY